MALNSSHPYAEIEEVFALLLPQARLQLSVTEIAEVEEYVAVGEYGLALESVVDIYADLGVSPGDQIVHLVKRLAVLMQLDPYEVLSRLC